MLLIPTNSHMPFVLGTKLYFCQSNGLASFTVAQTATAIRLDVPVQTVAFQPWSLCVKEGEEITSLEIEGLSANRPGTVFCNPVVTGSTLSFVHGGTLYSVDLTDSIKTPFVAATSVSSGFVDTHGITTVRKTAEGSLITFPDGETFQVLGEHLVRIIPYGENFIYTASSNSSHRSFVLNADRSVERITVAGGDVYKCCIDGPDVIHAVRGESFEDRKLHRDPYTLVPHAL